MVVDMDETRAGLWTNRRYVAWLFSDTAKGLGTSLASFAVPLVALIVTNDPAQAGIIGGVGMTVRLALTLFGGVLADRHHRVRMMLVGAVFATVLSAGFTALALSGALSFAALLAVQALLAVRAGAFEPASESAVKEIVPDEAMGRAQAANQGRDAALQLTAGPLGGLLLGVGAWLVGVVMTVCYALAAASAWLLGRAVRDDAGASVPPVDDDAARSPREGGPTEGAPAERGPNALREIREGFAWLFSRPDLSGVLWISTTVNLGFNAALTTVIYALQQAGETELTIGMVSAVLGATMLVGALAAPLLVPRIGAGVLMIAGIGAASVAVAALTLAHETATIALVLVFAVFLIPTLNAGMMGYFMVATPSRLLGRANAASGVLGMGAMPLAPLIAGFGLTWAGRDATLLVCAGFCVVSLLLAVTNRGLRSLPAEAGWAAHARTFDTDPATAVRA